MNSSIYQINNDLSLKRWYVFYTKSRSEKIAYCSLLQNQYDVFLPVVKEWKTWNNRQRKLITTPIFPGYIFIRTTLNELAKIQLEDKIVCCVKYDKKPVYISEEDICVINEMTSKYSDMVVNPSMQVGQKVRIITGSLAGHEGIVVKIKGKYRFGINIDALSLFASVEIDSRNLEFID